MMATRKTATAATINRAIDAMNARPRKNPALSEEDATFVREARARIKELDALVLAAIDKRQWSAADKLDSQRSKLWKAIDVREGRKPRSANPARKTRAVRVVAANPVKRPKSLYFVWTAAADGIKHERMATFEKLSEARKYAQAYADSSGKKMIVETKAL